MITFGFSDLERSISRSQCLRSVWGNPVHFRMLAALCESPWLHSYLPSSFIPGRHLNWTFSVWQVTRQSAKAPGPPVFSFPPQFPYQRGVLTSVLDANKSWWYMSSSYWWKTWRNNGRVDFAHNDEEKVFSYHFLSTSQFYSTTCNLKWYKYREFNYSHIRNINLLVSLNIPSIWRRVYLLKQLIMKGNYALRPHQK